MLKYLRKKGRKIGDIISPKENESITEDKPYSEQVTKIDSEGRITGAKLIYKQEKTP